MAEEKSVSPLGKQTDSPDRDRGQPHQVCGGPGKPDTPEPDLEGALGRLFAGDRTSCAQNPRDSTAKLFDLITESSEVAGQSLPAELRRLPLRCQRAVWAEATEMALLAAHRGRDST